MVESGERYYSENSQQYYKGSVEGDFPRDLDEARLSMFGGTTGHWGGSCRNLDKHDFLKKRNTASKTAGFKIFLKDFYGKNDNRRSFCKSFTNAWY